jgi:hypothetical protein
MEIESAARRMLLQQQAVTGYVQNRIWRHDRQEVLDGTGQRAIVLRRNNGWAQREQRNTQEFPILLVECWADSTRDDCGQIVKADALDNAYALHRVVDPLLHGKRGVRWGGVNGLLIVSSQTWAEPISETAERAHGHRAKELGDLAVVTTQYAICCIHSSAA